MAKNTKNFNVKEFACHCGCGYNVIDQRVVDICQKIRDRVGVPVRVNSGCRCKNYNLKVGGVNGSFHTTGYAADLSCSIGATSLFVIIADMKARGELPDLEYAILYRAKNFVHIDIGKKRSIFFEIKS